MTALRHALVITSAIAWLAACVGGVVLWIYKASPGDAGGTPTQWPGSTLPLSTDRATVLMFAHPLCPCTTASLHELERLISGAHVSAHVFFLVPTDEGNGEAFRASKLWRSALAVRGLEVHEDRDGAEAKRFGGATSGHVVAYGDDGRLLFSGGITGARGHEGGNPGRDALEAALAHDVVRQAPVFGCGLRE